MTPHPPANTHICPDLAPPGEAEVPPCLPVPVPHHRGGGGGGQVGGRVGGGAPPAARLLLELGWGGRVLFNINTDPIFLIFIIIKIVVVRINIISTGNF